MNRRNFFKGMFSIAVVATMPKIVVAQIEKIPIEEITPVPVLEKPKYITYHLGEQCMYLYDNDKLIAGSTLFMLEFKRELETIGSWNGYDQYRMGQQEWKVVIDQIRWFNHERGIDYFVKNRPLQCVLYNKKTILKGNVYITECSLTCSETGTIQEDVVLIGTGALMVTTKNE